MPDEERKDFIDIYLEKLKEFQKEGQHPLLRDHGEEIRALFSTVKCFWYFYGVNPLVRSCNCCC